jgi:hypothetical protein
MKNMLLTATVVGAAIAGLALYLQKNSQPKNKAMDAAKDAYQTMNDGIGKLERPAYHAMG